MVRVDPPPLGRLLARHSETAVTEALADTRVVLVTGARQCGKSTLLGLVAKGREAEWRNLDRAATRQAAIADPTGIPAGDHDLSLVAWAPDASANPVSLRLPRITIHAR